MQNQESPVRAAIDIGSNTIHIVVARCAHGNLDIVDDQVDLVRIGESVNATREISAQKSATAIEVLKRYKTMAEKHAAERIFVVATEAMRQASNSAEFLEQVLQETGLPVRLISGNAEATFTFFGATYELMNELTTSAKLGVMDLGGGSTEFVFAKNMKITWQSSIPIGSGWLHDRYLPSDPPSYDELAASQTFLQTYFEAMPKKRRVPALIVTGGSANSLLHLARRAFGLDMHNNRLTRDDLVRCEGLLSALKAEEVSQRFEQPLDRARILPAGALIIQKAMKWLDLNEIRVSPHGIREGVLLIYEQYGDRWLEYAEESSATESGEMETDSEEETFVQTGQRMLLERAKKMLEWSDEVLKGEDIESVHKMRVASRRLRATLDAFESCCEPGLFKKVYRRIKKVADLLGAVRDTDVMLQNLNVQLELFPGEEQAGIRWFIHRISIYRNQKQEDLKKFLESLNEEVLEQQIKACIVEGAAVHGKS